MRNYEDERNYIVNGLATHIVRYRLTTLDDDDRADPCELYIRAESTGSATRLAHAYLDEIIQNIRFRGGAGNYTLLGVQQLHFSEKD